MFTLETLNLALDLQNGFSAGPLFAEYGKRRAPVLRTSRQHGARRRARERKATPPWLTAAQRQELNAIHAECDALNRAEGWPRWHVAHTVPLQSPYVCGLNVPWNLELKEGLVNLREGTGTWPDMPMTQLELL